jgi:hypothetical protein
MAIVLTGVFLLAGGVLYAQDSNDNAGVDKYITLLRKDLRSDKKQLIAMNMVLTDAEATKFWPVYDRYTAEQAKVYDKRLALIKEYAANYDKLTNAMAASLNQRATEVDQALVDLRRRYIPLVGKVLPGKKSALFFQLDKRIGLLIDLQLAAAIPLVDH